MKMFKQFEHDLAFMNLCSVSIDSSYSILLRFYMAWPQRSRLRGGQTVSRP